MIWENYHINKENFVWNIQISLKLLLSRTVRSFRNLPSEDLRVVLLFMKCNLIIVDDARNPQ